MNTAPGATQGAWRDSSNFFHKGTNKRWVTALRNDQVAHYEEVAAERLEPELCQWLAGDNATSSA